MSKRIVEETIKKLKPPAEGNYVEWDRVIPGFGVRITAARVISFILNYRIAGRERRYTIGRWPDELTATAARAKAGELRVKIQEGHDPLEERKQSRIKQQVEERAGITLGELAAEYMQTPNVLKHRPANLKNEQRNLKNHILPALGMLRLDAVTTSEIATLHFSMRATPYAANRIKSLLHSMMAYAVNQNLISVNPVKGIKKFTESPRQEWLTVEQIQRFREALDAYHDQQGANVLRLLLLTGCRKNEALKAQWNQFDLARATWTKPAHTVKENKQEYVKLNKPTVDLLKSMMPSKHPTGPLFPGTGKGGCRVSIWRPWLQACKASGLTTMEIVPGKRRHKVYKYRPTRRLHDLRHSFASHLVSNGAPLQVVGKLLGHTLTQTTMRYSHIADAATEAATNIMGDIYDATTPKTA